jgi:hypothetical protein
VKLLVLLVAVAFGTAVEAGEPDVPRPPIVDQLLVHATDLELTPEQIDTLRSMGVHRARALAALEARLRAVAEEDSAAAARDALTLMQEIGRLRVLSEAEALRLLSPDQRRRWVEVRPRDLPADGRARHRE